MRQASEAQQLAAAMKVQKERALAGLPAGDTGLEAAARAAELARLHPDTGGGEPQLTVGRYAG